MGVNLKNFRLPSNLLFRPLYFDSCISKISNYVIKIVCLHLKFEKKFLIGFDNNSLLVFVFDYKYQYRIWWLRKLDFLLELKVLHSWQFYTFCTIHGLSSISLHNLYLGGRGVTERGREEQGTKQTTRVLIQVAWIIMFSKIICEL